MKRIAIIITILLCLCLCACSEIDSPTTPTDPQAASPHIYPFKYNSLSDLKKSINDKEELYKELSKEEAKSTTINNFKFFIEKFQSQNIVVPHLDGKVIGLRNKEGSSNISLYPSEQYDLPCIFYHPAVSTGENLYIKMTYLPDSITKTQEKLTASVVRKKLAPNSANIGNLGEQHKSIYEQKIQLADREVTALVIEYKADKRNSTIFVYNDMLIEVRNNPDVWTEEWFASLSFDSFNE